MTDREKLTDLLCKARSKSIDEILSDDISYAQQLEIEADYLLASGVTFHKWVPTALGFFPEEYTDGTYVLSDPLHFPAASIKRFCNTIITDSEKGTFTRMMLPTGCRYRNRRRRKINDH